MKNLKIKFLATSAFFICFWIKSSTALSQVMVETKTGFYTNFQKPDKDSENFRKMPAKILINIDPVKDNYLITVMMFNETQTFKFYKPKQRDCSEFLAVGNGFPYVKFSEGGFSCSSPIKGQARYSKAHNTITLRLDNEEFTFYVDGLKNEGEYRNEILKVADDVVKF